MVGPFKPKSLTCHYCVLHYFCFYNSAMGLFIVLYVHVSQISVYGWGIELSRRLASARKTLCTSTTAYVHRDHAAPASHIRPRLTRQKSGRRCHTRQAKIKVGRPPWGASLLLLGQAVDPWEGSCFKHRKGLSRTGSPQLTIRTKQMLSYTTKFTIKTPIPDAYTNVNIETPSPT